MAESHHVNYRKIYFTLLFLLVVSVVGPMFGIQWLTLVTAFGIAVVKANLVIANFMHLRWERPLMKWTLSASLVLMFLFFFGVAPDVMKHDGNNWVNDAALAATEHGIEGPHGAGGEEDWRKYHEPSRGVTPVPASTSPAGGGEPAAFDAAGAYRTICASCHGMGGAGDGAAAAALNPRPANFRDAAFWRGKTDEYLVRVIREGGAAVGRSSLMPAWSNLYTPEQALAIAQYLRTMAP